MMKENVKVVVTLNEKEVCVLFQALDGGAGMRGMFYSKDQLFHERCLDYFGFCRYNSGTFQESKMIEQATVMALIS
jgi:hypothetical protein